ncbi:Uncharacterised protein [Bordetella pertussis]|nr:Uncharacterised protein [Bordetella pertussis]
MHATASGASGVARGAVAADSLRAAQPPSISATPRAPTSDIDTRLMTSSEPRKTNTTAPRAGLPTRRQHVL